MNIKQYAMDFIVMFAIILLVNLIVTFLYGLVVHGSEVLDWESAFTFAISLGIVLSRVRWREKKQSAKSSSIGWSPLSQLPITNVTTTLIHVPRRS